MPQMPIAIVGRGCVLPGAHSPDALWQRIRAGDDLLGPPPAGAWPIGSEQVTQDDQGLRWSDRAGFVDGFHFDPAGFRIDARELLEADRCAHWVLEASRQALHEAGLPLAQGHARTGAILGHLSLPLPLQARYAISVWMRRWAGQQGLADLAQALDAAPTAPANRYMSALPTRLLARALGLGGEAFTLDAACASSLYAIKLACDALEDGRADVMLAGAACGTDPMFLHIGFRALKALSPTGQSRPFHRGANGLVHAEGAVVLALKRLADARASGDRVLGIIRGIGLSNDGGAAGLLVPDSGGQVRAMRQALSRAGLSPGDVALLECHATGTPVGDAVELASIAEVYGAAGVMPIGSLKSQTGHLLTVSGAAGLLKLLGAFEAGVLPASRPVDEPLAALTGAPVRLLAGEEPWPARAPRIAAVSSFGFGGNNAHVIVEADDGQPVQAPGPTPTQQAHAAAASPALEALAIVGLGVVAASAGDVAAFTRALLEGTGTGTTANAWGLAEPFKLKASEIRFPPRDLSDSLPQQVMLLKATSEALGMVRHLPTQRTGVLAGMECDAEIARQLARVEIPERLRQWAEAEGRPVDEAWMQRARDAIVPPLKASAVTGSLPNIVANRLNAQFKLEGFGYSVSADEHSGLQALAIAARALRRGELDAAIVAAVDLCCEPVSAQAGASLEGAGRRVPGDAAVVLVVKRLADAQREGETVLAVLEGEPEAAEETEEANATHTATGAEGEACLRLGDEAGALSLAPRFGHAHAASGLLHVAAAVVACRHRAWLSADAAMPWLAASGQPQARVAVRAQGGAWLTTRIHAHGPAVPPPTLPVARVTSDARGAPGAPRVWRYAAADTASLRQALERGDAIGEGPARLAFVATPGAEYEDLRNRALAALARPEGTALPPSIAWRSAPMRGTLAAVYTAAGSAYRGMGRALMLACPDLTERAAASLGQGAQGVASCQWMHRPGNASATPLEQLAGCSLLSQTHAALSREVLKLAPRAALGLSSGETNAILGLGAWQNAEGLFEGLAPLYAESVGGRFELLQSAWQLPDAQWASWALSLPADQVRQALADERLVYLTMIYGPRACAIGGERRAVERVVALLGAGCATPVDHDIAVHCPELLQIRAPWRALHHRATRAPADVRFYTTAACGTYTPDADRVADALLEMASGPVDFHAMVERAWQDGVRIFVEHGPRDLCSRWIGDILRGREHLAVALDGGPGQGTRACLTAAAHLWAAGVAVDVDALNLRLAGSAEPPAATDGGLPFMAHLPAIVLPPFPASATPVISTVPLTTRNATLYTPHTPMNTTALAPTHDTGSPIDNAHDSARDSGAARSPGVLWTRADLEEMSHGRLSKFYGPKFAAQDGHARQVRMPMPPLLLADRVIRIEGEPGSMGLGRIVTETDVTEGAWYLHEGSMPAGLEVESGQADLLLISWLGADLLNRGERVYRLLGCEMTFHGERRPRVGDTLRYEIEVTGHANTGGIRLFFFRYKSYLNGELRLEVNNGRAGFFTEAELENAGGVIWDPAQDGPDPALPHDEAPAISLSPTASRPVAPRYSAQQVRALAEGRAYDCFGAGFEATASHHRTPRIQSGDMQLIQAVEGLDPKGGPWGRGYLRATYRIQGDEWFFPGHFHNDPTMPGTLMCEAGVQMMSFYLAALGLTRARDGWRFELVPGVTFKAVCRGQVVPSARHMSYELMIRRLELGDTPTLWADVLLTVDGRKAFHGRNLGLRLVPDVPMALALPLPPARGAGAAAQVDGFTFDGAAMLHCATGLPSRAFGPKFTRFDGARNLPRLPSEPYQFMSRVTRCEGPLGEMKVGSAVEIEYDIPADAWYFDDNDGATMPFAVLLEAALQPCGWLAAYMGVPLHCDADLSFRNLDGDGVLLRPLYRGDGILRTTARCTSISRNGDIFIEAFDVECYLGGAHVYTLKTVFGHFTPEALADQKGLPATPADKEAMRATTGAPFDLLAASREARLPRLAHGKLLMLDRVVGHWPQGGAAGQGRLVAEFDVKPAAWFFKAHFYRDPVQPGSLGIEAMVQLLQHYMRERGLGREFRAPRFEPLAVGQRMSWKYRGQVLPRNQKVSVEMDITEEGREPAGPWVRANAWLWVDGLRIYLAKGMTMRVVEGG